MGSAASTEGAEDDASEAAPAPADPVTRESMMSFCIAHSDARSTNDDELIATLKTCFPSAAWCHRNAEKLKTKFDEVFLVFPDGCEKPVRHCVGYNFRAFRS
jgi:hypothetical protein